MNTYSPLSIILSSSATSIICRIDFGLAHIIMTGKSKIKFGLDKFVYREDRIFRVKEMIVNKDTSKRSKDQFR